MNAIDMFKGFAELHQRTLAKREIEVHRNDEVPVGEGWTRTVFDPVLKIAVWERPR